MSSTSSDESYVPPQKSRHKRYSKVKSGKHSPNKSCAANSSFDPSLPSCSGYLARPSSKPATTSSSECESEAPVSCRTPSSANSQTVSLPASLGIKRKSVTPSERQKRWQIVADENKELLDKINLSHYSSLRNSPLLTSFRKRKSDPEFRRSLNRPSKAIKIFSDEEEDKKPSSSSNGFPFTKEYDDYFRNLKICESDEELSKWLKDTKKKGRKKSTYKGGPLADEYLLPIDYKKLFESDSEYDTGIKEGKKQKSPVKAKSLGKESKSSVNKKTCTKKPKSAVMKQSTKKPKSGERNSPLPSSKPFDDNLNESHEDTSLEAYSVNGKTIQSNSVSVDYALALQIASDEGFSKSFNDAGAKLSSNEHSHYRHSSQSAISAKEETSKMIFVEELKSSAQKPSLTIRQKSTAKKQASGRKYRSRESKSVYKFKKADSLSSQGIPLDDNIRKSNFLPETLSVKNKIKVNVAVHSNYTVLVPGNESVMTDIAHSNENTKNLKHALNSKDKSDFLTLEVKDQCHNVVFPQLPVGSLSSALGNKVECAIIKDTDKNLDGNGNAKKIKIRLLSHEYIINDKIPRVSLMKIPFKLPYANILSR